MRTPLRVGDLLALVAIVEAQEPTRARRRRAWVVVATLAGLVPFLDKAFHIDDPVFVWTAQQILRAPLDFFGFSLNWYGFEEPAHHVMNNPPVAAAAMAGLGGLFGFRELVLHAGFLLAAAAAALGIHSLAERLCARPALATALALATPAFWVTSTTLGSDTLMLALWVWALRLWLLGLDRARQAPLAAAAGLAALATLTKYFAASLLPLFAAYALARRVPRALAWLALPVVLLASYQLWTESLYGRGLLLDAGRYALDIREREAPALAVVVGVAFTGGALVPALFLAPLLWTRAALVAGSALALAVAAFAAAEGEVARLVVRDAAGLRFGPLAHIAIFAAGGIQLVALGVRDLWRRRDADALLLALCLGGTLAFALVLNWTVNGRALIALAPVSGILVARALELRATGEAERSARRDRLAWAALAPAIALGAAIALADHRTANAARTAAAQLAARHGGPDEERWFLGHWGFQWYLEEAGARPVDATVPLPAGALLFVPENGANIPAVPWNAVQVLEQLEVPTTSWLSTMSVHTRAGFHAGVNGPLPFRIGPAPPERFRAVRLLRPLRAGEGRLVPEP